MITSKSQPIFILMILLIACAPKSDVESQSVQSPTSAIRKMPGGNCEDGDLMFMGMPENLDMADTTNGWNGGGQKLIISGKVYQADKKTPAKNVILYYYHTDSGGYYSPGTDMHPEASRHGHLRGWVKTGPDGSYVICTSRPAQYPNNGAEAHIHVMVKEPDIDFPYWIDAWVFDDDPLLTPQLKRRFQNQGGSGILTIMTRNGIQIAQHNVYLGMNIPGYPGLSSYKTQ
jgi:protocatechuate 3,4-dioxygenase, beta subunit